MGTKGSNMTIEGERRGMVNRKMVGHERKGERMYERSSGEGGGGYLRGRSGVVGRGGGGVGHGM